MKHMGKTGLLEPESDPSDDWETLSVKSGASSDDEEFMILKFQSGNEMPAFDRKYNVTDDSSSQDIDEGEVASVNTLGSDRLGVVSKN